MIIHNPILTGSFTVNGTDVSSITSSAASLTSLNAYTASQNNRNGTYATTGSNTFAGIQTVNSNLVVTGSITAQTLVVQTVTSSVVYSSGSNVFGNNIANTQTFTGSMNLTGSLTVVTTGTEFQVTNTGVRIGNVIGDAHSITGSVLITGSVGIGIGNPNSPLEVYAGSGSVFRAVYNGVNNVEIGNYKPTGNGGGGYQQLDIASSQINLLTGTAGGGSATSRIFITSGGYIGIGTTSNTSYQLQVVGANYGVLRIDAPALPTLDLWQTGLQNAAARNWRLVTNYEAWGNLDFQVSTANNNGPSATAMTIASSGRVGIGSGTPGGLLQVSSENSGNTQILLARNYATAATGNFSGNYVAEVRGASNGNISHSMLIHLAENNSIRKVLDISSTVGTIMSYASTGAITWSSSTYMIGGTTGFRFNSNDDAFNNFVALNNGNATLRGTLTQNSSDERLKNNIQIIPNALNKISQLRGVTFEWNQELYETSRTTDIGVIAQDVQSVLPDAVTLAPFDTNFETNTSKSGENYLTVYYEKLIPLLIEGMKELKAEIDELKNK